MLTLWDLVEPVLRRVRPGGAPGRRAGRVTGGAREARAAGVTAHGRAGVTTGVPAAGERESMQDRYDRLTREYLARYQVRVRRWRTSMSGMAWELRFRDGGVSRLIESPRPRGPMSMAIFLHEIGHHAIGFNRFKPRCLEEYHAWAWALEAMRGQELNVTDAVRRRMHESLWYAVSKARRRGLRAIPGELEPYLTRPARRRRTGGAPVGS